jgi:hypothetical protein
LNRGSMTEAASKMRESISVQKFPPHANGLRGAFVVSFTYPDRAKAHHVTRDLVAGFTGVPQSPAEVLDPPSLPQRPFFPNRKVIALIGTIAGIVLGVAATHLRKMTPATM